jgi:hypothetical protein
MCGRIALSSYVSAEWVTRQKAYQVTSQDDVEVLPGLNYDDLPVWMRKARREVDWAFLIMMVVSLVIAWPFFIRPGMPYNVGTQIELARMIEMAESIQSGILYPRWAADFNYGYGSPLWNYLAPLPHYLTGLHHVLAQTTPETSVKVVFVLGIGLGGMGMFSFVRRRWGTYAGILATAAYLYSPQIALVKPYLESDLPALLGMGFFLVSLWAFDRVMAARRGWDIGLATFALAALWLSDTPLNLLLVGILSGWLGWRALFRCSSAARKWHVLLTLGLGTGLSAFYWLPAWAEYSAVHWRAVSDYSIENWHRLKLHDLLAQPQRLDFSAVNPPGTAAIGVAVWGLALGALWVVLVWDWRHTPPDTRPISRGEAVQRRLVTLVRTLPEGQREALYFLSVGAGLVLLATFLGSRWWNALSVWPPFYPRDVLPVVAACGAVVAGQIGVLLEQVRRPAVAVLMMAGCLGFILWTALPTLPLPAWPGTYSAADLSTILRNETRGYMVASEVTGWLLPKAVNGLPQPSPTLIASYQSGLIDKVARESLPPAVQVDVVSYGPQSERLIVKTASPIDLTLLTFDFPGWYAKIDGKKAPIHPQRETGLITIGLPEGRHDVVLWFGGTPARNIGWGVSITALVAAVMASFRLEYRLSGERSAEMREPIWKAAPVLARMQQIVLLFAVLLFSLGSAAPRLAPERFTFRSPPGVVLAAQEQLPRALQGGIDLLAYDIEGDTTVKAGGELAVDLYWRAVRPDLPDYQAELAVVAADDSENRIAFMQHRHVGLIPSSVWSIWPLFDYYVRDSYYLKVDKDAPAGEYNIVVQLGRCDQFTLDPCNTIDPLFVRDERGSRLGQRIVLPTVIEVSR